jgi:ankyrin repeat protein
MEDDHQAMAEGEEVDDWDKPYAHLWQAARDNKMKLLIRFLNQAAMLLEETNSGGNTALLMAADRGHLSIVEALVRRKANLEATNKNRCMPLLYAICGEHVDVADYLVKCGANIHATSRGHSAMSLTEGRTVVRNFVIHVYNDLRARNPYPQLWQIADHGTVQQLHGFLSTKTPNELKQDINRVHEDKDDRTALHFAVRSDNANVASVLIEHLADIEVRDMDGRTPLHTAIVYNRMQTAKTLLLRGANINAKPKENCWDPRREPTCLELASPYPEMRRFIQEQLAPQIKKNIKPQLNV